MLSSELLFNFLLFLILFGGIVHTWFGESSRDD